MAKLLDVLGSAGPHGPAIIPRYARLIGRDP
jgi:hypothetical protein